MSGRFGRARGRRFRGAPAVPSRRPAAGRTPPRPQRQVAVLGRLRLGLADVSDVLLAVEHQYAAQRRDDRPLLTDDPERAVADQPVAGSPRLRAGEDAQPTAFATGPPLQVHAGDRKPVFLGDEAPTGLRTDPGYGARRVRRRVVVVDQPGDRQLAVGDAAEVEHQSDGQIAQPPLAGVAPPQLQVKPIDRVEGQPDLDRDGSGATAGPMLTRPPRDPPALRLHHVGLPWSPG